MRAALLALLACLWIGAAWCQDAPSALDRIRESGELRVGLEAGYIPFEMRDKRGAIIGFDVDMAKLMARKLGVRLRLVNTQWDGIIPALLTDKFDVLMSGMTITEERAQQVDFAEPYIVVGQSVLMHRSLAGRIRSVDDLNAAEFVVATKLGTTGDAAAAQRLPRARLAKYETEAEAVLEVRNGRVHAFVYDFPYNAVYAARNAGAVVHLPAPFTTEPLGWAVRKNDPRWLAWLNQFLAGTRADGSYQALYGKWFERSAWFDLLN